MNQEAANQDVVNRDAWMGINRTGAMMAPEQSQEATEFAQSQLNGGETDELDTIEFHHDYIADADPVGSVPKPVTVKGMAKSLMSKMKGDQPTILIDKLGERLAFERTGVRLYEALITKCSADGIVDELSDLGIDTSQMDTIRDEEAEHFRLIGEAIESLGGDPTAVTPCADIAGVNSLGILQTMSDPRTSVAQALNTMLSVELTDNAGWALLIELARESDHAEMAESFEGAAIAEARHVELVRDWLRMLLLPQPSKQT